LRRAAARRRHPAARACVNPTGERHARRGHRGRLRGARRRHGGVIGGTAGVRPPGRPRGQSSARYDGRAAEDRAVFDPSQQQPRCPSAAPGVRAVFFRERAHVSATGLPSRGRRVRMTCPKLPRRFPSANASHLACRHSCTPGEACLAQNARPGGGHAHRDAPQRAVACEPAALGCWVCACCRARWCCVDVAVIRTWHNNATPPPR
jgi:hypothetical protein